MLLIATPDAPILRVHYETEGTVAATEVGKVLSALGRGFERYARGAGVRAGLRLAVRRIEVGSLIADLMVVGVSAGVSVAQHPEALYGFVGFLGNVLTIAKGLKPGRNKQTDARLVETLLKPIAEGQAQQVNVFVVGDSNTVTIDREAVELVRLTRDRVRAPVDAADGQIAVAIGAEQGGAPLTLAAPRHLILKGKHGTAVDVKGRWYVRLEGEGGVLNPLELAPGVTVREDQSYSFEGDWEGRSYRIWGAHPIG